jgi:hypothetical protein
MLTAGRWKITPNRLRILVSKSGIAPGEQLKRNAVLHIGLVTFDEPAIHIFCERDIGPTYQLRFSWFMFQHANIVCRKCKDRLRKDFPEARERVQPTPIKVLTAAGRAEPITPVSNTGVTKSNGADND